MPICKASSGFTPKLYRRPSKVGIAAVAQRTWPHPHAASQSRGLARCRSITRRRSGAGAVP